MLPVLLFPPLINTGIELLAGLGMALFGKFIYDRGEKKGFHAGQEYSTAETNGYRKILQDMQMERENTKEKFRDVVCEIGDIDITAQNFFSRVADTLKGYTQFHIFCIACLSFCRMQILKRRINGVDAEEIKGILLGLVQAGFPPKLKHDIAAIWQSNNYQDIREENESYVTKLDQPLQEAYVSVTEKLNRCMDDFSRISKKLQKFRSLLKGLAA
ncbi:hypothetical protein AGMMS49587_11160 [Spirochaetia bacterium]|nr:hypothetical protein AGMMS49587_11160 [Spirochaetia bacterium]